MELLAVLIGEFVLELALAALAPLCSGLFLLLELVVGAACRALKIPFLLGRAAAGTAPARAPSMWPRRIARILLVGTLLSGIGVLLLNTVLFEPALRWGLARAEERNGIKVGFESARGNFLSGNISLRNVSVQRRDAIRSTIDLRIQEARMNVAMSSVFGSSVELDSLEVVGVEGSYQRAPVKSPRKGFVIDQLIIENASLIVKEPESDTPATPVPVTVRRLECRPFRKDLAVFDLLFRSNGDGTIAGAPFEIRSEGSELGRRTTWKAKAIPVRFLSGYVGGPFEWLTGGSVDVEVLDTWTDGPHPEIDSHWKVLLRDVTAEVPPQTAGLTRAVAEPVVRFLQAHPGNLPLEFRLKLSEGHFTGAASIEATGLLDAAADGVMKEMARLAKVPAEKIKELGRRTLADFRKFVEERKRKEK